MPNIQQQQEQTMTRKLAMKIVKKPFNQQQLLLNSPNIVLIV
jgi:hypothetical protein